MTNTGWGVKPEDNKNYEQIADKHADVATVREAYIIALTGKRLAELPPEVYEFFNSMNEVGDMVLVSVGASLDFQGTDWDHTEECLVNISVTTTFLSDRGTPTSDTGNGLPGLNPNERLFEGTVVLTQGAGTEAEDRVETVFLAKAILDQETETWHYEVAFS
ncbi:hypothetical protein CSA80_03700 [Candidatus Saccharibacteria bacterium]|nr:MAG: hypothetical protein CR973_01190 [Candidatus Saccharibacteria bacterium]PID99190.1 MAG: hypothetical protein CSA80_03700 [Candidatus Saccharibacteria bacterium]